MEFLESLPGNGISPTGQLEEIVEPTDLVKRLSRAQPSQQFWMNRLAPQT